MATLANMTRSLAWAAALLAILVANVGAQATCSNNDYISGVAAVPVWKTTASLLRELISSDVGFAFAPPINGTVFLPTDAAWAAFRKQYGASTPDLNRAIAVFTYNNAGNAFGMATTKTLAAASPFQTNLGQLMSYINNNSTLIPLTVKAANISSGTAATLTSYKGKTGKLGKRHTICSGYSYEVNKVLLPFANYAATPTTYVSELTRLFAPSPPPPSSVAPSGSSPSAATPSATPPTSAASTGSAFTLACGLAGVAALLLA